MPNASFTPEQISQILEEFFEAVGTRQYIGARYVPIFGRKGEDSIAWDNTKPYEPLTIVLYQGNSFTSRQYVPADVDITNETYWALTGNFNAQVEQYRRETAAAQAAADAAQADIDALLPKSEFSSEDTVKDYIDDKYDVLGSLLPESAFTSEATVKDYVDERIAAIPQVDELLPIDKFSAESTVYDAIAENANRLQNPSIFPCELGSLVKIGTLNAQLQVSAFQGGCQIGDYYYAGYYAQGGNAIIGKFEIESYSLVSQLPLGEVAHCNCINQDPNTGYLIVSGNQNKKMYVIDPTEMALLETINLGDDLIQGFCAGTKYALASISNSNAYILYSKHSGAYTNELFTSMGVTRPYAPGVSGRQALNHFSTGFGRLESNALNKTTGKGRVKHNIVLMTNQGAEKIILTLPYIDTEFEGFTALSNTEFVLHDVNGDVYTLDASDALGTFREFNEVLNTTINPMWTAPTLARQLEIGMTVQAKDIANCYINRFIPITQEILYGFGTMPKGSFAGLDVEQFRASASLSSLSLSQLAYASSQNAVIMRTMNFNRASADDMFRLASINVVNLATSQTYNLSITVEQCQDAEVLAQVLADWIATLPFNVIGTSATYPTGVKGMGFSNVVQSNSFTIDLGI